MATAVEDIDQACFLIAHSVAYLDDSWMIALKNSRVEFDMSTTFAGAGSMTTQAAIPAMALTPIEINVRDIVLVAAAKTAATAGMASSGDAPE